MLKQHGNNQNALIWISANLSDEMPGIHNLFEEHQTNGVEPDESLTHLPIRGVLLAHEMDWSLLQQARIFESQLVVVFYRDQRPEVPDRDNWLWVSTGSAELELIQQIVLRWAEEVWMHRNNPDLYELMGHDIRAPLAELHVMLLTNGLQNEKAIKDRVEQLRAVIDDIYWLSNSNDEIANWNIHQTDLSEVLVSFIRRIEHFAEDKPIEFLSSEIDRPGTVKGDEKMIGRIFKLLGDLIENRVSYGLIEIKGSQTDQYEMIAIHDMEQGWLQIDDESERGNTLFSVTKKLTYIKKLALAMGIQLDIDEKEDENILSLTFLKSENLTVSDEEKLQKMCVLVIDDNPLDLSWMAHMLEQHVGRVSTAQDGWEAFNLLDEESFDLILVDLQMPVMDGFTFIESLAEEQPDMIKNVVAVTAYANREEHKTLQKHGLAGLLYKPVKQKILLEILYRHSGDNRISVNVQENQPGSAFDELLNEELLEHIRQNGSNLMSELRWAISLDAEIGPQSEEECIRLKELIITLDYYEQDAISAVSKALKTACDIAKRDWSERTYKQFAEFQQYSWKLYKQITKIERKV